MAAEYWNKPTGSICWNEPPARRGKFTMCFTLAGASWISGIRGRRVLASRAHDRRPGPAQLRCQLHEAGGRWRLKFFEERGQALPWEDGDVFAVLGGIAAIDQPGAGGFAGLEFRSPEVEAFEGIGWHSLAGFRLNGVKDVAVFDDGVNFMAFLVAEEADGGHTAGMSCSFGEFGHQPVFEDGTAQRVAAQVLGAVDADEPGGKAGVGEIDLGSLDEALGDVGEVGTGEKDEEACLEHRQPRLGGGAADAGIRGERGEVYQLADAACTQLEKALEAGQILDIDRHAHIALQIGGDVALEPGVRVHGAVVDRREEPGVEQGVERGRGAVRVLKLGQGKWPEAEQ